MMVTADELINRLRDYALEHNVKIITQDTTGRVYDDGTNLIINDDKPLADTYRISRSYGGLSVALSEGTLFNVVMDLDLLSKDETFPTESFIGTTEHNMAYRSTVLTPKWNR